MRIDKLKNQDDLDTTCNKRNLSTCKTCGKGVSQKVKEYCISNKKWFIGYYLN